MKSSPYFWLYLFTVVKSKVKILQKILAFSEYLNLNNCVYFRFRCQKVMEWINCLVFDVLLLLFEATINLWMATRLGLFHISLQFWCGSYRMSHHWFWDNFETQYLTINSFNVGTDAKAMTHTKLSHHQISNWLNRY